MRNLPPAVTCAALLSALNAPASPAAGDWPVYLGDKGASHYSQLSQITPGNVPQLREAWTWHGGDARPDSSQIQCNPLIIGGVLYGTSAQMTLFALDAASGRRFGAFPA